MIRSSYGATCSCLVHVFLPKTHPLGLSGTNEPRASGRPEHADPVDGSDRIRYHLQIHVNPEAW